MLYARNYGMYTTPLSRMQCDTRVAAQPDSYVRSTLCGPPSRARPARRLYTVFTAAAGLSTPFLSAHP
ncbi:hypothetical protein CBM2587_A160505 [Cupriavidus taiwanensis]|uniref:Uncharacterized protein n=1 Tax=Cupriavidus taiwanensis TaxID=164546 RepID=A0A975WWK6_9BURK|nr:hypothetical protein CBM2587_A160505 [Cupriavidus taiwanensis]